MNQSADLPDKATSEALGLTRGQAWDLILDARDSEHDAEFGSRHSDPPYSKDGRSAAQQLWARGAEDETIDTWLGFTVGTTARIIARSRRHRLTREIVRGHLDGKATSEIARELSVAYGTIAHVLKGIGEQPRLAEVHARAKVLRPKIVALYRQGLSYKAIAARLGATESQVKSAVKAARAKGQITTYRPEYARYHPGVPVASALPPPLPAHEGPPRHPCAIDGCGDAVVSASPYCVVHWRAERARVRAEAREAWKESVDWDGRAGPEEAREEKS